MPRPSHEGTDGVGDAGARTATGARAAMSLAVVATLDRTGETAGLARALPGRTVFETPPDVVR